MYCICCKKDKIKPNNQFDQSISEEDMIWKKENITINGITKQSNINNSMVNDGIIHIIEAGYGSKYDGDRIILAICDDCIKENLEDGTLLYFDNYMYSDESFIKQEVDNSKKIYLRRKNLDKIIK
jgi:hypothetical protein